MAGYQLQKGSFKGADVREVIVTYKLQINWWLTSYKTITLPC
jgi:hypothetical protein